MWRGRGTWKEGGGGGLLTNREFDKLFALVSPLQHICKVELLTRPDRVDTGMRLPRGRHKPPLIFSHTYNDSLRL